MNHQKIYNQIIEKAKSENRVKLRKNQQDYVYYEKHHIIPRCIGGTDDEDNLVLLTAKEHYVCHKLLTFIYKNNRSIVCAYFLMTFDKKGNINISMRNYACAKQLLFSISISNETRLKKSISMKGKNTGYASWKHKPHKKETNQKISKANKGKIRSEEMKKKYSVSLKGKNIGKVPWNKGLKTNKIPWNKGLKMSKEFCENTLKGIIEKRSKNINYLNKSKRIAVSH